MVQRIRRPYRPGIRFALALPLLAMLAAPSRASELGKLETVDPLTLPPPAGLETLRLQVPTADSPIEKIRPSLWAATLAAEPNSLLRLVILLHEAASEDLTGSSEERESRQVHGVALVEHAFRASSEPLGLRNLRGLSHFPIVFADAPVNSLLALASLREVRSVELDLPIKEARVQGGNLIRAHDLRNSFGAAGSGIGVAVIDSGVDNSEPELAARVVAQGDFTGTTGDGTVDGTGHGTAVAGIIAGSSGGMARQANLWAMKVFDSAGNTLESWVLAALNSAYAQRNDFGGLHVVNMSLGAPGPFGSDCDALFPAWALPINQLVAAGIPVVVSSGNNTHSSGISVPACLSNTISVGAVYDANIGSASFGPPNPCSDATTAADKIACYSDSGAPLDVLAPAHCADTVGAEGDCFGGTSAAAPYTAGVVAQLRSVVPTLTPSQVRSALMNTGVSIFDARNGLTRKRIDAVSAYQSLAGGGGGPCVPGSTTLCIDDVSGDRRFKVEVHYQSVLNGGISGFGNAIPLSSLGITKGGLFWFFGADNPELMVKVVKGCGLNGHYWLYASGVTNLGLTATITDTIGSGPPFVITNPDLQTMASVATIEAFPCP